MYRLLIALFLLLPSPALAWWEYGHATVGKIALAQVKPATRAKIEAMMRQGTLLETPTCKIDTVEGLAYWPDCIKTLKDRFSYAYAWHYQNVDVCTPFDLKSACADGNCVSAQVTRNAKLLADKSLPLRERVMALAFLVHFVGDLHMPLHAGDRGDSGGNALKFFSDLELWMSVKGQITNTVRGVKRQQGIIAQVKIKKNRINGKLRTVLMPILPKSVAFLATLLVCGLMSCTSQ
jgi:hypothetical protein